MTAFNPQNAEITSRGTQGLIEAILWDNDGVLVDTEHIYFRVTKTVLEEVGAALSEQEYREFFLKGSSGAWHLAAELGVGPVEIEELRKRRNELYTHELIGARVALDGAGDVLATLAPKYRQAVVTSSRRRPFEVIHDETGFMRFFEFALVREDYEMSKPDPEPYLTAVKRMGLSPQACLVIEDTERGLLAANRAGLRCWVIPNELSRGSNFSLAERILDDVRDVSRLLNGRDSF